MAYPPPERRLTKSRRDRKLAGVCGGLAEFFGIDSAKVRLVMVLLALFGPGVIVYIALALILDDNPYD